MTKEIIVISVQPRTKDNLRKTIERLNNEKEIKLWNYSNSIEEAIILWIEDKNRII